jgi:signal transduction histidine kinase
MKQLIEGLLNVSKINAGQLHLNCSSFNITEMINECCDHIRLEGEYKLELNGDLDTMVFADRYKIDQVVTNLVNNAVKYAPESKIIKLHISKAQDFVKVVVQDFGPGIPESKIPHLFDRYYRADTAGYQYSGLGLGLYICADIIRRHKGGIGVESKEGVGSKFWFTLPLV